MAGTMEQAILLGLKKGQEERFALPDAYVKRLDACLTSALKGAAAEQEVDDMLRLAAAFESKLNSPTVGETLIFLLRQSNEAQLHLRRYVASATGIDRVRAFAQQTGRDATLRAPQKLTRRTNTSNDGNIRVSDFLTPGVESIGRRPPKK